MGLTDDAFPVRLGTSYFRLDRHRASGQLMGRIGPALLFEVSDREVCGGSSSIADDVI